ncbi:MAG: MFS transporter [Pseudomonadota bacterium]
MPNLGRFLAFSVIGSVALMPLLALPAMIGVLVDNAGMTDSAAGWSASIHFLAAALIGIALSLRIHHVSLRTIARIALVVAVAADIGSAMTDGSSDTFLVARVVAGLGLGCAYVTSVAAFARFDNYERGYGLFVTLQFAISGLSLYAIPVFADDIGATGLFVLFAMGDAIALLLTHYLPSEKASSKDTSSSTSELKILLSGAALFAIVGFILFEAANNAQFTYIERFGVALSASDEQIGISLMIASLLGIPGAFAIVLIGRRFGTLAPLMVGVGIATLGLTILYNAHSYTAYFVGGCFMGFSWAFSLPFIQTLLASIDRNGSAISAGSSLSSLGTALGPALAATVVANGGYRHVFILAMALFAVTVIAFVLSHRNRDHAV